jgi:hypothetical protein
MDGPERVADAAGATGRKPVGEDCRLRGVALRCRGGDFDAPNRLRALPNEEPLCNPGSNVDEYLAYCWITTGVPPMSFGADCGITLVKELSIASNQQMETNGNKDLLVPKSERLKWI